MSSSMASTQCFSIPSSSATSSSGNGDFFQLVLASSTSTVITSYSIHYTKLYDHLPDGPRFDLRYSPSQVDDIAHDLELRLAGGEVRYCGLVRCVHHQNTGGGFKRRMTPAQLGQVLGNDMKFFYSFSERLDGLRAMLAEAAG